MQVLNLDGGRTLSPKDLSLELRAPLRMVNYHVTELRDSGIVAVVDERQVRGAIEHLYRLAHHDQDGTAPRRKARRSAPRLAAR